MKRVLLALALTACPAPPPLPPVPPPGPATCADVCRRQAELGCPGARATANGASCLQVCENVQASGVVTWDLNCRARAATCSAADSCER